MWATANHKKTTSSRIGIMCKLMLIVVCIFMSWSMEILTYDVLSYTILGFQNVLFLHNIKYNLSYLILKIMYIFSIFLFTESFPDPPWRLCWIISSVTLWPNKTCAKWILVILLSLLTTSICICKWSNCLCEFLQ